MIKKVFLGILICCVFALLGCEAEKDFIEKSGTEQKYQLRRISFTEFKSNPNAFQKLKETCFKKSSNLKSKGVYNDDYGVFIDTTSIVVIEKGEKHSITFQIMDEEVSGKIENLVLSLKENGEYSAYITKYLLSEQEIQTLGRGQTIGDKYPATITQVENNSTENVSQTDGCINHYYETSSYCRDSNGEVIFSAGHLGDGCVGTSWTVTYLVIDISPGCGGSSPGSGYGGPSNGSGGDGGNGGGGSSSGSSGSSPGNPGNPSNGNGSNPGHGDPVFTTPVLNTNASKTFVLGLSAEQRNWWDSEAPEQVKTEIKNHIDQHPNKELAFDFADWAIDYLRANPTVTIEQFKNWFMGTSEGQDGSYDAAYWDNPNLIFPAQNLPTWTNFEANYPKKLEGPQVYKLVGGPLYDWHLADPEDRSNACALRVSRALNYSGVSIPAVNGTFKGGDGKNYFLSAKALNKWMRRTFGITPTNPNHYNITKSEAGEHGVELPTLLSEIKGIYSMVSPNGSTWASGHADLLYDNSTCDNNCYFYDGDILYIDIWELN